MYPSHRVSNIQNRNYDDEDYSIVGAGYVWFWYLFLCWGAALLCSKHSARREDSFLHQVGHEAGFLVTAVVSFTILVVWLDSIPSTCLQHIRTGRGRLSMLLLHRTQCFLKILGWGSSWYDAIFYTYLSWWGKLVSSDLQGSVVEEEYSFLFFKLAFNLIFLFYNCNATILMIIILLRCLLAFTISFDGRGVTCMTSWWYRILLV